MGLHPISIRLFLEYKGKYGWEVYGGLIEFNESDHVLFRLMAGTEASRVYDVEPIFQPRGILSDCARYPTRYYYYSKDEEGSHHASWLTKNEFERAVVIAKELCASEEHRMNPPRGPAAEVTLECMRKFEKLGYETRIVFWFLDYD